MPIARVVLPASDVDEHAAREHVDPRDLARPREPAWALAVERQRLRDLLRAHGA